MHISMIQKNSIAELTILADHLGLILWINQLGQPFGMFDYIGLGYLLVLFVSMDRLLAPIT